MGEYIHLQSPDETALREHLDSYLDVHIDGIVDDSSVQAPPCSFGET